MTITKLSERDLSLLNDLYDMRTLSARQIKRAYYSDNAYGYKRIRTLQDNGYLDSKPLVKGHKKETQYYYLTEKGIKEINPNNPRSAYKNMIHSKHLVERQLIINELYVSIKELEEKSNRLSTWSFCEGRKIKDIYSDINRNDLISGVIINKSSENQNEEKYGIYFPGNVKKSSYELDKIYNEIARHRSIRNNIILCTQPIIFKTYLSEMKPEGQSLRIIPYAKGINIIFNILSNYDSFLEDAYLSIGEDSSGIKAVDLPHATHMSQYAYYSEVLTIDIVKLSFIKRYSMDDSKTKPMHLLCWDTQVEQINTMMDTKKIILHPRSWDNDDITKGVDIRSLKTKQNINPKVENAERLSFTLEKEVAKFIKKIPSGKRSEFIKNAIMRTQEYVEFIKKSGSDP